MKVMLCSMCYCSVGRTSLLCVAKWIGMVGAEFKKYVLWAMTFLCLFWNRFDVKWGSALVKLHSFIKNTIPLYCIVDIVGESKANCIFWKRIYFLGVSRFQRLRLSVCSLQAFIMWFSSSRGIQISEVWILISWRLPRFTGSS